MMMPPLKIYHAHLGLIDYDLATKIQEILHAKVVHDPSSAYLLTLEHPPTITLGKNASESDLKIPHRILQEQGIKLSQTDRGGQLTGHNPGQLVAYPIFSLKSCGLGVKNFVCGFERITIATLKEYGINAQRNNEKPGVWVQEDKIASVGFRIEKKVSKHGIAINLFNRLDLFDLFIPCGLQQVRMTSLQQILEKDVDFHIFITKFCKQVEDFFSNKLLSYPAHELIALAG